MNTRIRILATSLLCIIGVVAFGTYPLYAADSEDGEEISAETQIGGSRAVTGQLGEMSYTAELYDASNGLLSSDANCVLGSSDGYIWIGGYGGVTRYDGKVFERVDNSDGLTSARGMFEDSKGRIWVGTNDNGVVVLDHGIRLHYDTESGLRSMSIRSFVEDEQGNIYIGSTAGVAYVDSDMNLHVLDDSRINYERVLKMEIDSEGTIYGQAKSGMVFTIRNRAVDKVYTGEELGMGMISTMLCDDKKPGYVYLCTESEKIYYGELGKKAKDMTQISVAPTANVHWICRACDTIWVASSDMAGYIDEDNRFHVIDNLPMTHSFEMVTSDYQGNLWFASSSQGVMKVVANHFVNLSEETGLSNDVVNATYLYDGDLYIGTDHGLQILDSDRRPVVNVLTQYIGTAKVRCIQADKKGNLWISVFTENLGLVEYKADGTIKNYTTEDGLPSNEIRCTAITEDDACLVGTNGGLAILKNDTVMETVTENNDITNTVFLSLCEGQDGEIYIGTDGAGIYVYKDGAITKINRESGLTSDVVMRIKWDEKRKLYWILTSNSLEYLKDGKLTPVTTLPYTYNYDLVEDNNENFWILSSVGIYCVKAEEIMADSVSTCRLFSAVNGVMSMPAAYAYSATEEDGTLYIAGRNGVCKVNINHFLEETPNMRMSVRSILCDGEEIVPNADGKYVLPATKGRIIIHPSVLDYSTSNPMVRVYLDNADDAGITVLKSDLRELEYTGLKYGNYNLHIQVLGYDDETVVQEETFPIRKQPRLMELPVVQIVLALAILAIAGFIIWRVLNVTLSQRQYEQIRQAKEEAERANSAKSRFLANISHEIRTPINTIMGMNEMILREDATDVPQGYFMSMVNYALDIRTASESLLGLINDLLDMAKIESGKMHLVERDYNTQELLRALVTMIRVRADEKDLRFELDLDPELPTTFNGDDGKIKQILLNLLTNAVKYTNSGGFRLTVGVESRDEETCQVRFAVKDSGIGIKQEELDKVFTAYERLDEKRNSNIQGTGLGLDISRRFAELMNGKLWCESEYGKGSEFILTVTQRVVDATPMGGFVEHVDDGPKGPYVPKFIAPDADVLVVDDNAMNLSVFKGLLKATQIFVTTAESGEECLEKLRHGRYHVVFLDHMMPGMDGIETVKHIRERYPDLPVYALTANSSAGEQFYISKGFNGYLGKPVDSQELEKTIMRHLPEEIMMKPTETVVAEELTELPEEASWLREVEGMSVDEGIKNSGGIGSFLHSISMFYNTIGESSGVIETAYKQQDWKLYTIKVHALKTSARIVGATALSEHAEQQENAGHKNDLAFIREHADSLLQEYRDFRGKLSALEQNEDAGDKPPVPKEELEEAYEALREVVPQMDYDTVEMVVDQMKNYKLSKEDGEFFEKLGALLRAVDWDGMEKLVSGK